MKKNICIIGGTGFVGTVMVNRLVREGHHVKIFSRKPERCKHLSLLPDVKIVNVDYFASKVLERQFDGFDLVINLVGILNSLGNENFSKVHIDLSKRVAEAAESVKVKRLLHMSALNAGNQASEYLRSKGKAQHIVHSINGVAVTSFSPSVIFGPRDSFINKFAGLLNLPGPMPLPGANAKFAPIYVEDVVDAFVNNIDNPATFGNNYPLCGPKVYTLKQIVEYTAEVLGKEANIISLGWGMSSLMARIMDKIPGAPMSLDNFRSMKVDSVCSEPVAPELGVTPSSLEATVPYYLGNFEENNNFSRLRATARR